jgi:hypothetical protein
MTVTKDNALKRNFLKISLFNLEQDIKKQANARAKQIDAINIDITSIRKQLKDIDFVDKENKLKNLEKFESSLKVIRDYEIDLFGYIDFYYKYGDIRRSDFITTSDEKPKPKPKSRKLQTKKPRNQETKKTTTTPKTPRKKKSLT